MGSEPAGFEQRSLDVAGLIVEAKDFITKMLEPSVDRRGWSVRGAGSGEIGQHVGCTISYQVLRPSNRGSGSPRECRGVRIEDPEGQKRQPILQPRISPHLTTVRGAFPRTRPFARVPTATYGFVGQC